MPHQRCYIPQPLTVNSILPLDADQTHYLRKVLRLSKGDSFEIINGLGSSSIATLTSLDRSKAQAICKSVIHHQPLPFSIYLRQAVSQMNHLEYTLEKCTEVGIHGFELFNSTLSTPKPFSDNQTRRIHSKLEGAMLQSGNYYIPSLSFIDSINTWQKESDTIYLYGSLSSPSKPLIHIQKSTLSKKIVFIVGPESGFTKEEEIQLQQFGAEPVSLTPFILRTETAGVVAVSTLMQIMFHND